MDVKTSDINAMRKAAQTANTFADMLRDYTSSNKKFNSVCREHGVDWNFARRILQSEAFCKLTDAMQELKLPTSKVAGTGIEQLYSDVFGIAISEISHSELPEDVEETVKYCLDSLTAREQKVLSLRYGLNGEEPYTLEECGGMLSVGKERIRQIETKALRKLKHPARSNILKIGKKRYDEQIAETERLNAIYLAAKAEEVERLKSEQVEKVRQQAVRDAQGQRSCGLKIPIEELDFSVRTFNWLSRAGINTLEDLLRLDDEQIMRIRNLGNKSAIEIRRKINDLKEKGIIT